MFFMSTSRDHVYPNNTRIIKYVNVMLIENYFLLNLRCKGIFLHISVHSLTFNN